MQVSDVSQNHTVEAESGSTNFRRVLIVEDDPKFLVYLTNTLASLGGNWRIKGVSLGRDAIAFARSAKEPLDLAIVDIGLSDMEGLDVISLLRRSFPDTPILIVSVIATEGKVMGALRLGANGYVLRDDECIDIVTAVAQVLEGNYPISPRLAGYLFRTISMQTSSATAPVNLSEREVQLLQHIAVGRSYAQAAHSMGLKISTVLSYSKTLYRKLGVNSKTQASLMARRYGLAAF